MNTYHITFGTYGTRLHGGVAPTVALPRNHYEEDFEAPNAVRYEMSRELMREKPCVLSSEQRRFLENGIPAICDRGKWLYHIAAVQEDHVHILLSADADPKVVRQWLKTWLSQSLNAHYGKRTWWAKGGSGKWVFEEDYFNNVHQYILNQRTHQE